jgi:hypothetical protein
MLRYAPRIVILADWGCLGKDWSGFSALRRESGT